MFLDSQRKTEGEEKKKINEWHLVIQDKKILAISPSLILNLTPHLQDKV